MATLKKQAIIISFVIILALLISACSSVDPKIKEILERGELRVGCFKDVERFSFVNESGKIDGFEPRLAMALSKDILGDSANVKIVPLTSRMRSSMLDSKDVDCVIAEYVKTTELEKKYVFSDVYHIDDIALLTNKDAFDKFDEMDGAKIAVIGNGFIKSSLNKYAEQNGISVKTVEFASYQDVLDALSTGEVQGFCGSLATVYGMDNSSTSILHESIGKLEYRIACLKDYEDMIPKINESLKSLRKDGTLSNLKERYDIPAK